MSNELLLWVGFGAFVVFMLVLDLGVFHRSAHAVSIREALIWCGVWIGLALLFNLGIYFWKGPTKALEFLAGYLVEEALSVDNLFVLLLIFSYFRVDRRYQHRVLFWGILGAIIMRAIFIGMGVALIQRFHWIIYIFGAFLVLTGIKMATQGEKELHPERNPVLKLFRKLMPVTEDYVTARFFVRRNNHSLATP